MKQKRPLLVAGILVLLAWNLLPGGKAAARPFYQPTPTELINAVNQLRLANGLAALNVHPILMQVAQGQADALLASEGAVGHTRPNGISFTQQLLLLGYPLWGDLSLGGYRSENFIFGYQLAPGDAVQAWLGDEPHTNTMLSPNRNDIGAGVAIAADGTVYLVIDTAWSTPSGQPQEDASKYLPGGANGTPDPQLAVNQYIVPITVSTARPNGDVYHQVQYGQTLWGIAIEYGTKIEKIRSLNNLGSDNTVYPNQLLLVLRGATQPPAPPTILPAVGTVAPELATPAAVKYIEPTKTAAAADDSSEETNVRAGPDFSSLIILFVILIIGGGVSAAWFIRDPNA